MNNQDKIQKQYEVIREANNCISDIAKQAIPDFHFLNHKVSDFWDDCPKSPLGWCVWDTSERGFNLDCACHFCGEPVERK